MAKSPSANTKTPRRAAVRTRAGARQGAPARKKSSPGRKPQRPAAKKAAPRRKKALAPAPKKAAPRRKKATAGRNKTASGRKAVPAPKKRKAVPAPKKRKAVPAPKKTAPGHKKAAPAPPHRPIAPAPAIWKPTGAAAALAAADPLLGDVIARVGPPALKVEADVSIYRALARSIVYQQLNGKAAATILARVQALGALGFPEPAEVLALPDEALRGAGLSANKLRALRDLAQRHVDGSLPADEVARALGDDALVATFTQVRGIGRWTVEMLLMFYLGRTDVLPATDYGVRHGFFRVYGGAGLPAPADLLEHGARWAPHRTLASWYLWRAVELP